MIYNIKIITKSTTFIVLKVELPFKCKSSDFTRIYRELYKNRITHEFIRNELGLPDSVRLKLNGNFKRWLYLIDEKNCIYKARYKIQTAAWFNILTGKWQYVSIFPSFIKQYCQPCLHMLEYISCQVGKGEYFYRHIDDPEGIIDCEDRITRPIRRIEKESVKKNYPALLNSKYTEVYNRPLSSPQNSLPSPRQFPALYNLVLTARQFFGKHQGVLSFVNTILLL